MADETGRTTLLVFRVTEESLSDGEADKLFDDPSRAVGVLPQTDDEGLIALCGAWVRLTGGVARVGDSLIVANEESAKQLANDEPIDIPTLVGLDRSSPPAASKEPWTRPPDEELH